jgi:purine nucleosidase
MRTMRKLIIDCDPGLDDASALFLAFAARDKLEILGVTTVAGNVGLAQTARNACVIRQLAGREDVPVFAGCARPLVRAPVEADDFHGANGLGDAELPQVERGPEEEHAVMFLVQTLRAATPRSVTLAVTGPCTNIAAALILDPKIAGAISEVVMMGGARSEGGNITASAEYNIYADPHAAAMVLNAGAPVTLFGLDTTHQVRTGPVHVAAFEAAATPITRMIAGFFKFSNRLEPGTPANPGAPLHDPCTIAYLLWPELFEFRHCHAEVETEGKIALGHTQIEFRNAPGRQMNAQWALHANAPAIMRRLLDKVRTL